MKTSIVLIVIGFALLLAFSANAAIKLVKAEHWGTIGKEITISRIVDPTNGVICYVTRQGEWGVHSVSCVK